MTATTKFWSWEKVEAGHYVLTTDTRYTATVRKMNYGIDSRYAAGGISWTAEAASPSGKVRTLGETAGWTMAQARRWALGQIDHLVQQDETELLAHLIRPTGELPVSVVTMGGPVGQTAWFTIEGDAVHRCFSPGGVHYTYKVTVERWDD